MGRAVRAIGVSRLRRHVVGLLCGAPLFAASCDHRAAPAPAEPPVATAIAEPPRAPAIRAQLDGRGFPDKVLALTWDDGPDTGTFELAQYLHRQNVSATFFVVGAWIDDLSADPGAGTGVFQTGHEPLPVLADLVELGHRLGNHTRNHVLLDEVDAATVAAQLADNQAVLDRLITNEWRIFRTPGGAWSAEASGAVDTDPRTRPLVGPIRWDIDGKDWEKSLYCRSSQPATECEPAAPGRAARVKPSVVARRYLSAIASAGRGVVLFHDRVGHVGSRYALDVARLVIPELKARGYVFAAPVLAFSPLAPRAARGRSDLAAGAPLLLGDIDGDGRADACEHAESRVSCAIATSITEGPSAQSRAALGPVTTWESAAAGSFARGSSARLADVDGDGRADLCTHRAEAVSCVLSRSGAFGGRERFSGAAGGGRISFGDVDGDGKDDVCARAEGGVSCARSLGNGLDRARLWIGDPTLGDALVALADVDGDGRADLCARSPEGLTCAVSRGTRFGRPSRWSTDLVDAASLCFGDLNGDGRADVCGRRPDGIACALSTGSGFTRATAWVRAEDLASAGLGDAGAPIALGDIDGDGRADLCGRGLEGVVCGLSP